MIYDREEGISEVNYSNDLSWFNSARRANLVICVVIEEKRRTGMGLKNGWNCSNPFDPLLYVD